MRSVGLRVHETSVLELPGRGSAGYSWVVEQDGEEGVVEVRRRPPSPAAGAEPGGPPPAAGSLPELLEIQALAPGRVALRFELRRSWEQQGPLEHEEVEVVVAPE